MAETARLLAIDAQPEVLQVVERTLASRFDCHFAGGAEEARRLLDSHHFDLVLCDVQVPGGAGMPLVEQIARERPETALVLLAGNDDPELAERAFELGAHGYLVKPFWPGQLLITTLTALRRSRLELAQRAHSKMVEEQMQALMERAPFPVYIKDRQHRYLMANSAAHEIVDLEPNELIGKTDEELMSPDSVASVREADLRVLTNQEPVEREETIQIAGEERVFLSVRFPYIDSTGEVVGVFGVSADITANRDAEQLQKDLAEAQARAIAELRSSRLETVERLSRAIEMHDAVTGSHVGRIAATAASLGRKLGLGRERVELLREAAPMHDVGKIATPDHLLSKPGPLNGEERAELQRHTLIGHDILDGSDSDLLQTAARIALTHHERYDGSGYPRGLRGEEIPIEGRIVAVADVLDALLSDRPYRQGVDVSEAVAAIRAGRGTHFDPAVVDALLENLDEVLEQRG
jgi:putative two-component system response regulator